METGILLRKKKKKFGLVKDICVNVHVTERRSLS